MFHATCDKFADDTCINVSDACNKNLFSSLQLSDDKVLNRASNNVLITHPKKNNNKIHGINIEEFHRLVEPILRVRDVKYLAVDVDGNLSWSYHIKGFISKVAKIYISVSNELKIL